MIDLVVNVVQVVFGPSLGGFLLYLVWTTFVQGIATTNRWIAWAAIPAVVVWTIALSNESVWVFAYIVPMTLVIAWVLVVHAKRILHKREGKIVVQFFRHEVPGYGKNLF